MKIKIEYKYKPVDLYPYKAYAFNDIGDCISVKSSKLSFDEARSELTPDLDEYKNRPKKVTIPEPEEIEL